MKLIIAIVRDEEGAKLMQSLNREGFSVTKMAATGSFLRSGNMTLMVGTEAEKIDSVFEIIKKHCERHKEVVVPPNPSAATGGMYSAFPIEVEVGGATVFVLDVERFEKL